MVLDFLRKRIKIYGAIALSLAIYFAVQFFASAPADASNTRLDILDKQIDEISQNLESFSAIEQKAIVVKKPILIAQSSKNIAALNVRIGALEEQVRALRGQVDGLQFQLTQMQTFLERQQEDYEFRFEQLEGGVSGKTSATPQSDGDMLVGEASQNQATPNNETLTQNGSQDFLANGLELATPGMPLGGDTQDLSIKPSKLVTNADADAQYRAGYDAIVQSNFSLAEGQFSQFVELFPTHPQAPDATVWLGEVLIHRGAYHEASQVLLKGFQSYSASSRAPDILLKLGIALVGSGEKETACRTFAQVLIRYPNISPAQQNQLSQEMQKAQC